MPTKILIYAGRLRFRGLLVSSTSWRNVYRLIIIPWDFPQSHTLTANIFLDRIAMILFTSSAPTDVTRVSLRETSQPCWGIPLSQHLRLAWIRSSPIATHRINMDSHRLRAGPVNENIADITPLLEYTSPHVISLLYQPTKQVDYTTSYDFLTQPWNQVYTYTYLRLATKCCPQHIPVSCTTDCTVLTSAIKQ